MTARSQSGWAAWDGSSRRWFSIRFHLSRYPCPVLLRSKGHHHGGREGAGPFPILGCRSLGAVTEALQRLGSLSVSRSPTSGPFATCNPCACQRWSPPCFLLDEAELACTMRQTRNAEAQSILRPYRRSCSPGSVTFLARWKSYPHHGHGHADAGRLWEMSWTTISLAARFSALSASSAFPEHAPTTPKAIDHPSDHLVGALWCPSQAPRDPSRREAGPCGHLFPLHVTADLGNGSVGHPQHQDMPQSCTLVFGSVLVSDLTSVTRFAFTARGSWPGGDSSGALLPRSGLPYNGRPGQAGVDGERSRPLRAGRVV